jgi:hypothetical protein
MGGVEGRVLGFVGQTSVRGQRLTGRSWIGSLTHPSHTLKGRMLTLMSSSCLRISTSLMSASRLDHARRRSCSCLATLLARNQSTYSGKAPDSNAYLSTPNVPGPTQDLFIDSFAETLAHEKYSHRLATPCLGPERTPPL